MNDLILEDINVELEIKIGKLTLSALEASKLKSGMIFDKKVKLYDFVDICYKNTIVGKAKLVEVDNKIAIELVEVL